MVKKFNKLFEYNTSDTDLDKVVGRLMSTCRQKLAPNIWGIILLLENGIIDANYEISTDIYGVEDGYLIQNIYFFHEYNKKINGYGGKEIYKLLKLLLEGGSKIDVVSSENYTPIMDLVYINNKEIIELLLSYKPDLSYKNDDENDFFDIISNKKNSVCYQIKPNDKYPEEFNIWAKKHQAKKFKI